MTWFVGIDLTSAFSLRRRPVDVAVLDDSLHCTFHLADWPNPDLVVARDSDALWGMIHQLVPNPAAAQVWAIDGPQALAASGTSVRRCEIALSTPGRTPATLPSIDDTRPFQGYIRSSVDLFAALVKCPAALRLAEASSMIDATLFEVFPGAEWAVANGGRLPAKASAAGRSTRRQLFEVLGVRGLPAMPSADQHDALMAAYLAWSTRHQRKSVELIGSPVATDDGGTLREGMILHCRSTLLREPLLTDPVLTSSLPDGHSSDDDWTEDDALRLRFTDTGLVHGNTPENRWLERGRDYVCETQPPHSVQEFRLRYTSKFTGGLGWTCVPTIPELLASLGRPITDRISKAEPVRLRVRVVADR